MRFPLCFSATPQPTTQCGRWSYRALSQLGISCSSRPTTERCWSRILTTSKPSMLQTAWGTAPSPARLWSSTTMSMCCISTSKARLSTTSQSMASANCGAAMTTFIEPRYTGVMSSASSWPKPIRRSLSVCRPTMCLQKSPPSATASETCFKHVFENNS